MKNRAIEQVCFSGLMAVLFGAVAALPTLWIQPKYWRTGGLLGATIGVAMSTFRFLGDEDE